jgi:trigger factor
VNVQLNSVSDTRKNLVVTLDPSEVDAEHLAVVNSFVLQARIPGFRPGKAPVAMIAKRFGKEIAEEFKQKVVAKAYRGALEKEKLPVLNIVNVEEGTIEPGTAVSITVAVDVRPDFTLPDYSGLTTEAEPTDATDAEIANVIDRLRAERADFKPAARPAQKGDFVKLAYTGALEGKPIAEIAPDQQLYGKVPQTWEEVEGAQSGHLPGLGAQLAGVQAGDKKTVDIVFPADFTAVLPLAGKTAQYEVEIQEVRERILPEMNEEFFKSNQVANLEELRTQIVRNLKMQKEHANQMAARRQVTEAIAALVNFSVPESMVEAETQGVLRQFIEENMRRGVPAEQFEKDKKGLFAGAQQTAEKRVKIQLILAKVAEAEKIEVSERDLDNFIYREAQRSNQRPEKLAKDLGKDRARLRSIQESIIFDKAVDFLVSKAKVTVKTAPTS